MAESGVQRNGDWQPAFEGQRPPFEPGHQLSVRHGSYSLQLVSQDAEELLEKLRASEAPWLADIDGAALESWAFALAQCRRLRAALAQPNAAPRVMDDLIRWDRRLASWTSALGFDPLSRERLGRDAAVARSIADRGLQSLQERGAAHVDRVFGEDVADAELEDDVS